MIVCRIEEITPAEYEDKAQAFIELMQGLQVKKSRYQFRTKEEGEAGPLPKVDVKYFSERAAQSEGIAESYSARLEGKRYVANAVSGEDVYGLVGLMILKVKADCAYIDYLTTHPLSSNVGVLMIEHAVKVSREHGKGGTVALFDASGGSFYDNLGFVPLEVGSSEKILRDGKIKSRAG